MTTTEKFEIAILRSNHIKKIVKFLKKRGAVEVKNKNFADHDGVRLFSAIKHYGDLYTCRINANLMPMVRPLF